MAVIEIDGLVFDHFIKYDQITDRVRELGEKISVDYKDKNPVFIGILNGCFMFMADLMKEIAIPCEMSFVKLASYEGTAQGIISELIGVGIDLQGRDVVLVEDVVDTGNSLVHAIAALKRLGANSIAVCSLLYKPTSAQHHFDELKYIGFEIEKEFVIGYGLDYNGQFRNLKDIYREVSLS